MLTLQQIKQVLRKPRVWFRTNNTDFLLRQIKGPTYRNLKITYYGEHEGDIYFFQPPKSITQEEREEAKHKIHFWNEKKIEEIPKEEIYLDEIEDRKDISYEAVRQASLEEDGHRIRGFRLVLPIIRGGRRIRNTINDYIRIGKAMKNLLILEIRILQEITPTDLAVMDAILEGKNNLIIKLDGPGKLINMLKYLIPKEKYAILVKEIKNRSTEISTGYTTFTRESQYYLEIKRNWKSVEFYAHLKNPTLKSHALLTMLRYLRIKRREERPYDREETLEEMDEREESGWDSSAYEKRIEEADDKAYEEVEAIQKMIEERKIACELNPVTLEIEEEAEPPIKKMKTED